MKSAVNCLLELLQIGEDLTSDHEVRSGLIVLLQEIVKLV